MITYCALSLLQKLPLPQQTKTAKEKRR